VKAEREEQILFWGSPSGANASWAYFIYYLYLRDFGSNIDLKEKVILIGLRSSIIVILLYVI
jgi:hypothetical protein